MIAGIMEMALGIQDVGEFCSHTFFAKGHTEYALEAIRLQMQLASLPPRLVHHITWGRFVNMQGGLGHNLPCDFHNEHVNKLIKEHIKHMGSNFSQRAITKACSVTYMEVVTNRLDQQCGIHVESSAHSMRSDIDVKKVVYSDERKALGCREGPQIW